MLGGGAGPPDPELREVAEWVGLEEAAVAASPLRSRKGLHRGDWPLVDPG